MLLRFLLPYFALSVLAEPLIVGLGSSYSAGPGLTHPIGELLRQKLAAHDGQSWTFTNDAISSTVLSNITEYQAPKLKGTTPNILYIVSGGNDLDYVTCLDDAENSKCKNLIPYSTFKQRYADALDAVVQDAASLNLTIFCLTYLQSLGPDTTCPSSDCSFNSTERSQNSGIYTKVIDYITDAVSDWKSTGLNNEYDVRLIPMRQKSAGHDVGSSEPWANGKVVPKGAGGIAWHPNNAGAEAVAQILFENYTSDASA